ncbi:MAG: TRAP transporter large permease subunit, partial [Bryobacterales bacterium]|nr:TRAP transporter large permease subunit [Bryobacterales bacterium]
EVAPAILRVLWQRATAGLLWLVALALWFAGGVVLLEAFPWSEPWGDRLLAVVQHLGGWFATGTMAAVPGLLAVVFYAALVAFIAHRHPQAFPAGRRHSWRERFVTLKNLWPTLALFLLVLGSMYLGWVTVTEAAGIGAVGALVIGLLRGQLDRRAIKRALIDSLRVSSAIMLIVVGAYLFGYFLTVTQFTQKAVDLLVNLP